MSRSLGYIVLLCAASGFAATGCGARTGDDELLGDGPIGVGGRDIAGGTTSGGNGGSGGYVPTGGAAPTGGVAPTGGIGGWTGGFGGVPTGGVGGNPFNPCCEASDFPGCQDPFITQCVCDGDPFCCEASWDGLCAEEVESFGCGSCNIGTGGIIGTGGFGGMPTGGTAGTGGIIWTGGFGGIPTGGTAGTGGIIWTGGFGGIPTGGTAGTGGTGGTAGNCCAVHAGAGCQDDSVESCVCKSDPYCCSNHWDSLCVGEVESLGCGSCNMGTGGAGGTGGNGTGGVGQCEVVFPDECGSCLCNTCYDQLIACATDFGCIAIQQCFEATSCVGVNCYKPQTCKSVIDAFGGWNGPSMTNAFQFAACVGVSGCNCD